MIVAKKELTLKESEESWDNRAKRSYSYKRGREHGYIHEIKTHYEAYWLVKYRWNAYILVLFIGSGLKCNRKNTLFKNVV